MIDGYPENHELEAIRNWDTNDFLGLFEFIQKLWFYPMSATRKGREIELHTGGWSGNEEIIDVLQTTVFWCVCWLRIDRGGHYYLAIPNYITLSPEELITH